MIKLHEIKIYFEVAQQLKYQLALLIQYDNKQQLEPIVSLMLRQRLYERASPDAMEEDSQASEDSWEFHCRKIMAGMEGTEEEKEAVIRKRILRYFGEFKLESESYFSIRNDIDYNQPGVMILPQKLVMYGVDYLTFEKARNYFQGYITTVRRIDDSHFLIEFRSESECLSALNKKCLKPQTYLSPQEMFRHSNKGWIEMKPYHEFLFERKLMARFATNVDRIDDMAKTTKQSHSYAYSEARRRFIKSLKADSEANQRRRENYSGKRINAEHETHSKSRERSREKHGDRHMNDRMEYQRDNRMRPCHCERDRHFERSRSRSRSSSMDYQDERVREQEKIRESNFKFEMYIKRRDNKTNQAFEQKDTMPKLQLFSPPPAQNAPIIQKPFKPHTTSSTISDEYEIVPMGMKMVQETQEMNSSACDFEKFLQNLKISDSKHEYSAFDLEMEG